MMKNIKIAFFDIDGTMIDMEKKVISEKMLETLVQMKQNGIIICIATGRSPMVVPCFPGVEFDAFLTFNGSYCFTKDEVIFKNPIPLSDVQTVIQNAGKINRPVSIANKFWMGANGRDQDLEDYFAFANKPVEIVEDFEELAKGDIYQIMLGCRKDEYDQILENVKGAKIAAWWSRAADIIPADGGKGLGIGKVLEYYNLTKEESIAFGDGMNDIELLQAVGTGVAMGNAAEEVKRIADCVCKSAEEDGIYYYWKSMRQKS